MYTAFDNFDIYNIPEFGGEADSSIIGNNKKNVLVVIKNSDLNDENKDLLKKIFAAKEINIEDDTLIHSYDPLKPASLSYILQKHEVNSIFIFGIDPKELGVNIDWQLYNVILIHSLKILVSHKLEDLKKNQGYKKQLWEQMKTWQF